MTICLHKSTRRHPQYPQHLVTAAPPTHQLNFIQGLVVGLTVKTLFGLHLLVKNSTRWDQLKLSISKFKNFGKDIISHPSLPFRKYHLTILIYFDQSFPKRVFSILPKLNFQLMPTQSLAPPALERFPFPNNAEYYLFVNIVFSYKHGYQSILSSVIKLT